MFKFNEIEKIKLAEQNEVDIAGANEVITIMQTYGEFFTPFKERYDSLHKPLTFKEHVFSAVIKGGIVAVKFYEDHIEKDLKQLNNKQQDEVKNIIHLYETDIHGLIAMLTRSGLKVNFPSH